MTESPYASYNELLSKIGGLLIQPIKRNRRTIRKIVPSAEERSRRDIESVDALVANSEVSSSYLLQEVSSLIDMVRDEILSGSSGLFSYYTTLRQVQRYLEKENKP